MLGRGVDVDVYLNEMGKRERGLVLILAFLTCRFC